MTQTRKTAAKKQESDRSPTAPLSPSAGAKTADAGMRKPSAEQNRDRLDSIEQADDRAGESPKDRARNIGAETAGDPGELLSQPIGEGNYMKDKDGDVPLRDSDHSES